VALTTNQQWATLVGRPAQSPTLHSSSGKIFRSTTAAERFLLLVTVALLPLENHLPSIGGFSIIFLMFLVLAAYIAVNRLACLDRVWHHPVFTAAFLFLLIAGALEYTSPLSMYGDLGRFGLAMSGAMMISCLCRDRLALRGALFGYLCASLWLSTLLFMTSYGALSMTVASNFQDASDLRADAFRDNPIQGNLNSLALMCAQGGVVALAFALLRINSSRFIYLGISGFCLLSTFLTMSRGGAAICILACGAVLFAHGFKQMGKLFLVGILLAGLLAAMPGVIFSRMSFSTEKQHGKMESRAWVYSTALDQLPEYVLTGIGAGNFWKKWGFEKGFATGSKGSINVSGVHNTILQITIYYGSVGLLAFVLTLWQVFRALPSRCGQDALALGLLGIIVSLGVWMLVSHNFYDKSFAIGIGLLVGSRQWIWPSGSVEGSLKPI